MSFLRSNSNQQSQVPQYTGLQIQTSSNAVPITILWGINRIAPNLIWTGNFWAYPQKQGGKGGGHPVTGYDYQADIMLGLCEGPIAGANWVYQGQAIERFWDIGLSLFYGSTTQGPWGYLSGQFNWAALFYRGLAYFVASHFDLGQSAALPSLTFETYGLRYGTGMNGQDADPALVVLDFLTSSQYGVGFPSSSIDASLLTSTSGASSYQTYCKAAGFAISPALVNQETASSILTRWLQLTNTACVWSGGKLKFIPYGDTSITAYGATFTPNVTPIYDLTDDDFVGDGEHDPVECQVTDAYSLSNWQTLEISNRYGFYDATPIDVWDQNAIESCGLRKGPIITAHEITDYNVAHRSAQLILQRGLAIRNHYTFKLSFEYCLLEPMDLVTITDPLLGLNQAVVRITEIEEDDNGAFKVTAEEFPAGIATAVEYPVGVPQKGGLNRAVVPSAVNPPVLFEPTVALLNGAPPQIWAAVSGGLAQVYKLAEDGSTGFHYASASYISQAAGTQITWSCYAQGGERSACMLQAYDGFAFQSASFDLAAGIVSGATPDIISTTIEQVPGSSWYRISISWAMAATCAVDVFLFLENPVATISYTGTIGDGLYVWGQDIFVADGAAAMLLVPFSASGATLTASGVATPEGMTGNADPYWGGANVWISTDGSTYTQIGTVNGPGRQGVLAAPLPAPSGSNPDTSSTLSVSLVESGGTLNSTSDANAAAAVTLCVVDNELLAFATAVLTGPNAYSLTYLERGLYGTVAASHSSGAQFARLDGAVFKYDLPLAFLGVGLYFKFQSFNIFGLAVQDLSTCQVYTYTPMGAGAGLGPIASLLAAGVGLDFGSVISAVTVSDDFGSVGFAATVIDLESGSPP